MHFYLLPAPFYYCTLVHARTMASLGRNPCQFPQMHLHIITSLFAGRRSKYIWRPAKAHHGPYACVAPRSTPWSSSSYAQLPCIILRSNARHHTSGQAATNVARHWQLLVMAARTGIMHLIASRGRRAAGRTRRVARTYRGELRAPRRSGT